MKPCRGSCRALWFKHPSWLQDHRAPGPQHHPAAGTYQPLSPGLQLPLSADGTGRIIYRRIRGCCFTENYQPLKKREGNRN